MPGISGVISRGEAIEDPPALLRAFEEIHRIPGVDLHHRSFSSPYAVIDAGLTGLVSQFLEQPAVDEKEDAVLFVEGEVFNGEELASLADLPRGSPAALLLLRLFLRRGPTFASLVDGNFTAAAWEGGGKRRLTIVNDRMATKPLHYFEESDRLIFASEKKAIFRVMESAPILDEVGILQTFAHRHNVGGRTFVEGLKVLPPGSRLEFGPGGLTVAVQERFAFAPRRRSAWKAAELADEWGSRLKDAMKRRLRDKSRLLLGLSGGLDSRAVACALPGGSASVWAFTRGYEDSPEVLVAAEVARRLRLPHYRQDPAAVPYSRFLPKSVWRTECAVPFYNTTTLSHHASMKEKGDFIIGGQFGDVGSGAHIYGYTLVPSPRGRFVEKVYERYRLYSDADMRGMFEESFLDRNLPLLKEAFLASFDAIEAERNAEVYELWDLNERQARLNVGAAPVDSYLFEKVYPFLDRAYMDFALSLPISLRIGQSLYQSMIHRIGPEVRSVPSANTGLCVHASPLGNLCARGYAWLAKRAKGAMPGKARSRSGGSSELSRLLPGDAAFYERVRLLLEEVRPGIFRRSGIEDLMSASKRGTARASSLLGLFATFAEGYSLFLAKRPLTCPPEAAPLS